MIYECTCQNGLASPSKSGCFLRQTESERSTRKFVNDWNQTAGWDIELLKLIYEKLETGHDN
jgi:hypothetical protein